MTTTELVASVVGFLVGVFDHLLARVLIKDPALHFMLCTWCEERYVPG